MAYPYLLIALGATIALVALLWAVTARGERSRRRGRQGDAPADRPDSEAEVAAAVDPHDPRAAAWAVLREPIQVEQGLLDVIARRPPARQFRIGTLLGFGLGLAVAGGCWVLWQGIGGGMPPAIAARTSKLPASTAGPVGTGKQSSGPATVGSGASGSQAATGSGTRPATGGGSAAAPGPSGGAGVTTGTGAGSGSAEASPAGGTGGTGKTGPAAGTVVTVVIDQGMTAPQIAARLKEQGLIADEAAFLARLSERGMDTRLRAGTFQIPAGSTLDQVIDRLAGM